MSYFMHTIIIIYTHGFKYWVTVGYISPIGDALTAHLLIGMHLYIASSIHGKYF